LLPLLSSLALPCPSLLRPPPIPTLFPYTTLFRSGRSCPPLLWGRAPCMLHVPGRLSYLPLPQSSGNAPSAFHIILPLSFCLHLRSEEHTSELQSRFDLVCRLLLEKKKSTRNILST